jgi:phenylacetic acid degradation operon negative regulatory protein
MVVITTTGRGPAERADLRTRLAALRLAELREGVWLRPANLTRTLPGDLDQVVQRYTARPDRPPGELAETLWPLGAWSATARDLPADWPGSELRAACTGYQRELIGEVRARGRHLTRTAVRSARRDAPHGRLHRGGSAWTTCR